MGCKKKYSLVMSHALVNFSLSPRLEIWGMLLGLGLGLFANSCKKGKLCEGHDNNVQSF